MRVDVALCLPWGRDFSMHSKQDIALRMSMGRMLVFPIGRMKQMYTGKLCEGQVFAEDILIWWFVPIMLVGSITRTQTAKRGD